MLISLPAPPVVSAAAIVAMLALQPRLDLLASISLTLAAPLSMPLLGQALDFRLQIDMIALAVRLIAIAGATALIAFACLHFGPRSHPSCRICAGTSIAVIGLVIIGLATAQGVRTY